MGLPLYADECVDARIVAGLRRRGADILTAADAGLLGQADERHLESAQALGRVILSGDQDFLAIAHRCASRAMPFPGLIFIQPKSAVGEVIRAVVLLTDLLSSEDIVGWIEWVP